jgi:acyl carrier protein
MVPDAFVVLPRLPLTPNGKVDRRALPAPDRPEVAYEEPEGAMESRVAEIWSDVLSLERVGRSDDFFSLGGHSLRAAQIIARLREETGVELSTAVFFTAATVRGVALALEEGQTSTTDNLDRISALLDELDDEDD